MSKKNSTTYRTCREQTIQARYQYKAAEAVCKERINYRGMAETWRIVVMMLSVPIGFAAVHADETGLTQFDAERSSYG